MRAQSLPDSIEVTTRPTLDKKTTDGIIILTNHIIATEAIRAHISDIKGLTGRSCYNILLLIYRFPRRSAQVLEDMAHAGVLRRSLPRLQELGYIKAIGRPRLIVPFQKFKVDRGWVITDSGVMVIKNIFEAMNTVKL